jgi:cytochrome d ubiquinol oxidase subunit II
VVVSLFSELYPRVMVSSLAAANDLTIARTASSPYALGVMTVVLVVLLPIVLLYQGWTLHVFRNRVTRADLTEDGGGSRPPPTAPAVLGAGSDGGRRNGQDLPRAEPANSYRRGFRFATWLLSWAAALVIALLRGRSGRSGARRTPGARPAAQR